MTRLAASRPARIAVGVVALAAIGATIWFSRPSSEETAIRARLEALRTEVNTSAAEGLATVAHAAKIGGYFTDNVVVDLGKGTSPIQSRETLMGMAARLQPRTAAFRLEFDDIGVEAAPDASQADVTLTASFVRRSITTGEESRELREFALVMIKDGGTWRIARVTAIDTFR